MMEIAGAAAIGTTSFGVAVAHGYPDGERIPWSVALTTIGAIAEAISVPLSVDIESGRGTDPRRVESTVSDVATIGAHGINLEDSAPDVDGLIDANLQADRISAARDAARSSLFINARCDAFFTAHPPPDPLAEVITRAAAYADAGADGLFVPGLLDLATLRSLVEATSLPVNVMVGPGAPSVGRLREVGVRRLSQGASAFAATMGHLQRLTADFVGGRGYERPADAEPAYAQVASLTYR